MAVFTISQLGLSRCAQEQPTPLPITFFSEAPGSLSDAEVRLFAFLAVDTNSRARLDAWIASSSNDGRDDGGVLAEALRCRVKDTLVIAGRVLAELPGAGQVADAPDGGELTRYLDRIRRQSSQVRQSRPLLGELLPSGKGKYGTRCAAAVPRVVELLQNSSERERLETATAALAPDLNRKPTPKKSVLKVEHACAVNAAAEATAECARAVNALTIEALGRSTIKARFLKPGKSVTCTCYIYVLSGSEEIKQSTNIYLQPKPISLQ